MKDSSDPTSGPIAHNLIKLIINVCFSAFAFAVHIITVIAITYQPPDPWLESAVRSTSSVPEPRMPPSATPAQSSRLARTSFPCSCPDWLTDFFAGVITEAAIEKAEERIENSTKGVEPSCDVSVHCSDPRVLIVVERFNLRAFRSIAIIEYRNLVNGSKPGECDVGWTFRNKTENSTAGLVYTRIFDRTYRFKIKWDR